LSVFVALPFALAAAPAHAEITAASRTVVLIRIVHPSSSSPKGAK
jgi:hypothetical protein